MSIKTFKMEVSEQTATLIVECLRFVKHDVQNRKDPASLKKTQVEMLNKAINEVMENTA